jgi:hypothetical protein
MAGKLRVVRANDTAQAESCKRCNREPASPSCRGFCRGCWDHLAAVWGPGVGPASLWDYIHEMVPYRPDERERLQASHQRIDDGKQ